MRSIAWPPVATRQREQDLKSLADDIRGLPVDNFDSVERSLVRFLAVRSAGYIEATRDDAAEAFCRARSSAEVWLRVKAGLRTGLGVRPQQILDFVGSFDTSWKLQLEEGLLSIDGIHRSRLGALVEVRKKIAHGHGEALTSRKAFDYLETSLEVGHWLLRRFDPN